MFVSGSFKLKDGENPVKVPPQEFLLINHEEYDMLPGRLPGTWAAPRDWGAGWGSPGGSLAVSWRRPRPWSRDRPPGGSSPGPGSPAQPRITAQRAAAWTAETHRDQLQTVLRIQGVYPESRISDPGSKNSNKGEGLKKLVVKPFFEATKFHKI